MRFLVENHYVGLFEDNHVRVGGFVPAICGRRLAASAGRSCIVTHFTIACFGVVRFSVVRFSVAAIAPGSSISGAAFWIFGRVSAHGPSRFR